jgi:hypothetical protein
VIHKPQNEAAQTRYGLWRLRKNSAGRASAVLFLFLAVATEATKTTTTVHSKLAVAAVCANRLFYKRQLLPALNY